MDDSKQTLALWLALMRPPTDHITMPADVDVMRRVIQENDGLFFVGWLLCDRQGRRRWFGPWMGVGDTLLEACRDAHRNQERSP